MRRWTRQTISQRFGPVTGKAFRWAAPGAEDRSLYSIARRRYGTWYKRPGRRRCSTDVSSLVEAGAFWPRFGNGTSGGFRWRRLGETTAPCTAAGKRHFGSWSAAVRAAGLDVRFPRQWTDEAILAAVRDWVAGADRDSSVAGGQRTLLRRRSSLGELVGRDGRRGPEVKATPEVVGRSCDQGIAGLAAPLREQPPSGRPRAGRSRDSLVREPRAGIRGRRHRAGPSEVVAVPCD